MIWRGNALKRFSPRQNKATSESVNACRSAPSLRMDFVGALAFREKGTADLAAGSITASGSAMLSAIENDLQMKTAPRFRRIELFQILLRMFDSRAIGQLPSLRQAVDVCVDRECRDPKGLHQDHRGSLVANSGERFEGLQRCRYLALVLLDQNR